MPMESFKLLAVYSLLSSFINISFTLDMITPSQPIQDAKNQTLVSSGGTFEAGFFSLEDSTSRYVGIWHKNISPRTYVWVANKDKPLSDSSGVLKVDSETGILSILDGQGTTIWSSNATATQNKPTGLTEKPIVQLMESGNLVVKDGHNLKNVLWQSFDYPDDTLVTEMKLDHNESEHHSNSNRKKLIGNVVGCTVFVIVIIVLGLTICIQKKKLARPVSEIVEILHWRYKSEKEDIDLPLFDFPTISIATNHFSESNKLGQGGFGPVYKGVLADKQEIAVKRLSKTSAQGTEEFKNEVMLIAKLQHRNLVKLLGCSIHQHEKLLIYEFLPNGSLDYFIFDSTRRKILDWTKRIQIINGTARGLLYLHQDSRLRIIHRDLKSSNILLDNGMNPKISDFGLARTFGGDQSEANTNRVMGTYGYISPEYAMHGSFSDKSDVFSFGVIVLEVISGKENRRFSDPHRRLNLIGHAWRLWNEERPMELIDDLLDDSATAMQSEILRCIHVGLLCVQQIPEDRPDMSSVVLMLNGEKVLPEPSQPGFYVGKDNPILTLAVSSSGTHEESSLNESFISVLEPR